MRWVTPMPRLVIGRPFRILALLAMLMLAAVLQLPASSARADGFPDTWDMTVSHNGTSVSSLSIDSTTADIALSGDARQVHLQAPWPGWTADFEAPPGESLTAGRSYWNFSSEPGPWGGQLPTASVTTDDDPCASPEGFFHLYELSLDPGSGQVDGVWLRYFVRCLNSDVEYSGEVVINPFDRTARRTIMSGTVVPSQPDVGAPVAFKFDLVDEATNDRAPDTEITVVRRVDGLDTATTVNSDVGVFLDTASSRPATYTAIYPGDAGHTAAVAVVTVAGRLAETRTVVDFVWAPVGPFVTVKGCVTDAQAACLPGVEVLVARTPSDGDSGTRVTADDRGQFSARVVAPKGGTTYRVSFAGDRTYAPSASTLSVLPDAAHPVVTLSGPGKGRVGHVVRLSGAIRSARGSLANLELTVVRQGGGATKTSVIRSGPRGRFQLSDRPRRAGPVHYTVTWPGNESYSPAQRSWTVHVGR